MNLFFSEPMNPFHIVKQFEQAIADYTGAAFAVATNSCTMALLIACAHYKTRSRIPTALEIPKRTYVSVPMSIMHAGFTVTFRDEEWRGAYQLFPSPIYDCARRFTSGMFVKGQMQCVSFHASKILGLEQGGAILHDNVEADAWLRRARFDGRTEGVAPKNDTFTQLGYHCYMNPSTAALGLLHLHSLPGTNADLPNDDYPNLAEAEIFQ